MFALQKQIDGTWQNVDTFTAAEGKEAKARLDELQREEPSNWFRLMYCLEAGTWFRCLWARDTGSQVDGDGLLLG